VENENKLFETKYTELSSLESYLNFILFKICGFTVTTPIQRGGEQGPLAFGPLIYSYSIIKILIRMQGCGNFTQLNF
jgi:hypothetical protein